MALILPTGATAKVITVTAGNYNFTFESSEAYRIDNVIPGNVVFYKNLDGEIWFYGMPENYSALSDHEFGGLIKNIEGDDKELSALYFTWSKINLFTREYVLATPHFSTITTLNMTSAIHFFEDVRIKKIK